MKKFFKKEYLLLIFIFIMVLSTIIIKPLGDLDELWNYNVARNIADGKVPYRDISTITTPLLPFVNSIFLKLISNELITMRVLAAVLCTGILYMIFKILKIVTKETNFSMIVVILIGWLFKDLYCIDYNYMVLFLTLIILYLELKESKSFIIGFLAGLAICTKQSIGAVVAVATMLEPLILIHKKDDIKKAIKEIGKRLLGMAIPIIILFAYLLVTNAFQEFISYAVQGISTFDNHVEYTHLFKSRDTEIAILSKVMPISVVATIIASIVTKFTSKKFQDETKTKFNYLQKMTLYSLPILIVMYPIADKIHFVIGITIALLVSCYCIFLLGNVVYDKITYTKKKFWYKTITLIVWLLMITITGIKGITNINTYIKKYQNLELNKEIEHFSNIEISKSLENQILQIDAYIKEKEKEGVNVYVLDAEAAVYNIPLEKYTKDFDMFLKGNLGKDGEEGQIEKIKEQASQQNLYLVKKENQILNWQSPLKVISFVRENLKLVGEIENYDAYM